jgi:hypothetical protein
MGVKARLRRLVVVGDYGQDGIRPGGFGVSSQFDRVRRCIGTCSSDDRNSTARLGNRDSDQFSVFGGT